MGKPSRYSSRLPDSDGSLAPGVMMPMRFKGSAADNRDELPV